MTQAQLPAAEWSSHRPTSWPYEFGELKHDVEFEWYTGEWGIQPNGTHGAIMRKEAVKAGTTVRIVMASRFGDIGITDKLETQHGYGMRGIMIDEISKHLDNLRKTL